MGNRYCLQAQRYKRQAVSQPSNLYVGEDQLTWIQGETSQIWGLCCDLSTARLGREASKDGCRSSEVCRAPYLTILIVSGPPSFTLYDVNEQSNSDSLNFERVRIRATALTTPDPLSLSCFLLSLSNRGSQPTNLDCTITSERSHIGLTLLLSWLILASLSR